MAATGAQRVAFVGHSQARGGHALVCPGRGRSFSFQHAALHGPCGWVQVPGSALAAACPGRSSRHAPAPRRARPRCLLHWPLQPCPGKGRVACHRRSGSWPRSWGWWCCWGRWPLPGTCPASSCRPWPGLGPTGWVCASRCGAGVGQSAGWRQLQAGRVHVCTLPGLSGTHALTHAHAHTQPLQIFALLGTGDAVPTLTRACALLRQECSRCGASY